MRKSSIGLNLWDNCARNNPQVESKKNIIFIPSQLHYYVKIHKIFYLKMCQFSIASNPYIKNCARNHPQADSKKEYNFYSKSITLLF